MARTLYQIELGSVSRKWAMSSTRRTWINANLATMDPGHARPYGTRERHALRVENGRVAALVPMAEWGARPDEEVIDAGGRWITPGLIDCHTHLVWGGSRAGEFERRLAGATYAEIAAAGGGIRSTVTATRAASEEELALLGAERLRPLLAEGLTTVEIKSGYGLSLEHELKQLRAARRVGDLVPVRVTTTLLALHAVPPEFDGRADDFVTHACEEILPAAAEAGLADAVDVFCEHLAFSPDQCERVFAKAAELGLPVKGPYGAALEPGRQQARGPVRGAVGRPYRVSGRGGRRGDRGVGDGGRAAAGCLLLPAREAGAAGGSSCGGRACRWRWRPTSIRAPRPSPRCG